MIIFVIKIVMLYIGQNIGSTSCIARSTILREYREYGVKSQLFLL